MQDTREGALKFLQVCNWGLLAIFGVSALSWIAVCLMIIPYPRMMAEAGAQMEPVFARTAIFGILTLIAAVTTWLLRRKHAWQWFGQLVLVAAIIVALAIGFWWRF